MNPWFELIRNNFLLKAFSLALAILIWLAIQAHLQSGSKLSWNPLRTTETVNYTLPVKLLVTPGQGQAFKVTPPEVRVTVSGDVFALRKMSPSKIQVYVRIDDAKSPMMSDFSLDTLAPREVTVENIEPKIVTVETTPGGLMIFPQAPIN